MAGRKTPHATAADTSAAVDACIAKLVHPHKDAVVLLRETILAADPSIAEGVKWNAPSFRTHEYFATMHLRAKTGLSLILHLGAKTRALPAGGLAIDDPDGLLAWLGRDRAQVAFADAADVRKRTRAAVAAPPVDRVRLNRLPARASAAAGGKHHRVDAPQQARAMTPPFHPRRTTGIGAGHGFSATLCARSSRMVPDACPSPRRCSSPSPPTCC